MKEKLSLKKKAIKKLVKNKYTYKEIGEMFGVSRQRIHQIFKNYCPNNYTTPKGKNIIRSREIALNTKTRNVWYKGRKIKLTKGSQQYKFLKVWIETHGRASYETLISKISRDSLFPKTSFSTKKEKQKIWLVARELRKKGIDIKFNSSRCCQGVE